MTKSQGQFVSFLICYMVALSVYMGVRSNQRRRQQEKLRVLEQIKVEKAKRRTKSVVFARKNIRQRTEIKKEWLEVKDSRTVRRVSY